MDDNLRMQILRAAVRDGSFLRNCFQDIRLESFPTREEQIIAKAATEFYSKHKEPIGFLVRSDADDAAQKYKLGAEAKKKLKELIDKILGSKMELVPVKALEDRLARLRHNTFYENAVNDILTANEKGDLDADLLAKIVERANAELNTSKYVTANYGKELEGRIERRRKSALTKYPVFMIPPVDVRMKGLARGRLGVFMAPPGGGKGLSLVYMTGALAMQGFNVLHITLEDPQTLVEDRLDASLTGMSLKKLNKLPNKLRRRFLRVKERIANRIRIVEELDADVRVADLERMWERERRNGFIADAIVVDYDDFILADAQRKGDAAKRLDIEEIYTGMKRLAAKLNIILWTAAQTIRDAENKKVILGKHTAEGYSKFRRAFIMIGIGEDADDSNLKWLHIIKNREDRKGMLIPIMSDYDAALFYDDDATREYETRTAKAVMMRKEREQAKMDAAKENAK